MKAHGFRVCFTPLLEVLFTFPSRYLSTIGLSVVFSLTGWAPQIPAEFLVLRGTQVPSRLADIVSRTGLSPSTDQLSRWFRYSVRGGSPTVLQPRARPKDRPGLGSCAFARHYLRNHCYFLFLRVLRCFSSPGSPTGDPPVWRDRSRRVSPFGHPRVAGHLPLTAAFRSLSRPSSPPRATGIPHAPLFSFLSPYLKRLALRTPPRRGTRRGRAFSTLVVVARFLYQLDFSLRFEDPHRLHAHARKTDRTGQKRASLISLRVPNMSMTSLVEDNGLEPLTPCLQSRCSTS